MDLRKPQGKLDCSQPKHERNHILEDRTVPIRNRDSSIPKMMLKNSQIGFKSHI